MLLNMKEIRMSSKEEASLEWTKDHIRLLGKHLPRGSEWSTSEYRLFKGDQKRILAVLVDCPSVADYFAKTVCEYFKDDVSAR